MIDPVQAAILGAVQGLTEFVPVSSSGHLVVVPTLLGWREEPGLAFDAVLHLGTLLAVVLYFRAEWVRLAGAWLRSVARRQVATADERLAWLVLVGCVPAALAGLLLESWFEGLFGSPGLVGYFLLVTAGILALSEGLSRALGRPGLDVGRLGLPGAVLIGVAQAVAILPGVSRSGATIAGGLLVGLTRPAAARFSFLLAAPVTLGAGLTQLPRALAAPGGSGGGAELLALAAGFATAAVVGYLCIDLLLRYLGRGSLYPFAAYCAVLGLVLVLALGGGLGG